MRVWTLLALLVAAGCKDKDDDSSGTQPLDDQDGDGFTVDDGDCDDTDPQVNPAAAEVYYSGIDEDCDPSTDDTDQDADGYAVWADCDDTDAAINPDAEELCDGVDNDCSGVVDDGAKGGLTGWTDADGDGYGDAASPVEYCGDPPTGVATNADDCDDSSELYYPGAAETCTDTEDYNCDGSVGSVDTDGDGWIACEECDDSNASVNPAATETCNDIDDNCDGVVDTDAVDQGTWYADTDGDGYGDASTEAVQSCDPVKGYTDVVGDCNDADPAYNPGAEESCTDAVDYNCDGSVGYADLDSDGYPACEDCDDSNAAVNAGATEVCDNVDNDCDGDVDGGAVDASTWYLDGDSDGYGDMSMSSVACDAPEGYGSDGTDCDDSSALTNPGAAELCDGVDNDCDSSVDEDAVDTVTTYEDGDGDGYGADGTATSACEGTGADVAGDCDDTDAAVNPDGGETCDGVDEDCNGLVDDDPPADGDPYFRDSDNDGYGSTETFNACTEPDDGVRNSADCDDTDADVSPSAPEVCDGQDNDCDGNSDEAGATGEANWYEDADGDGYGNLAVSVFQCSAPAGYVSNNTDCDDADPTVNPSVTDDIDYFDTDCDGWVDDDALTEGDLVITEVHRQPRFGATSTQNAGMWFEIYNTTSYDIDMGNWYILRTEYTVGTDTYFVDPADGVVVPAGSYAVFCKTDNYEGDTDASVPLYCDYIWGDETQSSSYSGYFHDNTFNLQRDNDRLALYVGGGSASGRLIDDVIWYYDATDGYWPREATRSMTLDPNHYDTVDNDDLTWWCAQPTSADTWWVDGTSREYGTPGSLNYDCVSGS